MATVAHWANAIATAFLVGLGIWAAKATQRALELSERAWLSPVGAAIKPVEIKPADSPKGANILVYVEKDRPIYFILFLNNTGKEPALNLHVRILNSTVDGYDSAKTTMESIEVPENTSCENLKPNFCTFDLNRAYNQWLAGHSRF
jgi:hypothetical protein